MLGSFNIQLPPKEAFVAAINAMKVGAQALTANAVTWGTPSEVSGTPFRRQIRLSAKPESPFIGFVDYTYDAIDTSRIISVSKENRVPHSGPIPAPATVHSVLPTISAFYGIPLQTDDWLDGALVDHPDFAECYSLTLAPSQTNILFIGTIELQIWPKKQIVPLVLGNAMSDGLYPPLFSDGTPQ